MESYSPRYPDDHERYPPSPGMDPVNRHAGGRTPSPTPSEVDALTSNVFNVKKYAQWKFWARRKWIPWYILALVVLVATILISVYDKQIVHWLTPAGKWMRSLRFGWLIPICILFIISFPPLFGHEIIAILVGVIWGLGIGFLIVCAGTFLGELGNFYAFRYCCRSRGEKMEKTSISYACLARVVREGGFFIALVIRLSVIPGHFSTAVFSTCGMGVIVFSLAAFFSLPKQFITVFLGVIIEEAGTGTATKKDKIISDSVLGVTLLITFGAAYYIWREMTRVKPAVIYERRKARQVKMATGSSYGLDNDSATNLYQQVDSETTSPLYDLSQRSLRSPSRRTDQGGRGTFRGQGGYMPSYRQGRYGETLDVDDARKSTEIVGWETRQSQVADMRHANWPTKARHPSDDDDDSEESALPSSKSHLGHPPPNLHAPPNLPYPEPPSVPQHKFQISDPPVTHHTLLPSDSTYQDPPFLSSSGGHAQPDVSISQSQLSYLHDAEPSDGAASFDSQHTLMSRPAGSGQMGHSVEPTDATDASFYTAASGSGTREPSPETHSFQSLPPAPSHLPMTFHTQSPSKGNE